MHFVLSHIENTSQGKKRTGNYYADILATEGRKMSTHEDKSKYLKTLRGTLLSATIRMLEGIDKKLIIFRIPDGPSTHVDDLSAQHLCQPGSSQYEDPMTLKSIFLLFLNQPTNQPTIQPSNHGNVNAH